MKVVSFISPSMIDYPGKIACTIFTPRCNYRCPTCHAKQIVKGEAAISEERVLTHLDKNHGWIDGVVMCGGEPTLHFGLKHFLWQCKKRGLATKLDTNGSRFGVLQELHEEKLVDYVAMDIKGPFSLYRKLTNMEHVDERDGLLKGMLIASKFPDYEFRHTCVPLVDDNELRWMTREEIKKMAEYVVDNTQEDSHRFYVQKFVARGKNEMLDEIFSKERLPKEYWETPAQILEMAYETLKRYLPNARIR